MAGVVRCSDTDDSPTGSSEILPSGLEGKNQELQPDNLKLKLTGLFLTMSYMQQIVKKFGAGQDRSIQLMVDNRLLLRVQMMVPVHYSASWMIKETKSGEGFCAGAHR